MISLDTSEVTVGDKRQLSVSPDADDVVLSLLEAVFTAPSGTETTYAKSDFVEDSGTYTVSHKFDEAGFWHVRVVAEGGGGRDAESDYIRAVTRQPADLSLLTRDTWPTFLSEDVMTEDPEELMRLAERAERKVVDRYREVDTHTGDLILDNHFDADVRLDGWAEDDQGNPDLQEMDAGLLEALRESIANIVEFWVNKPNEAEHIESQSQGDRSVTFRDKDLPSSVYAPLRRFDDRSPWF